MKEYATRRGPSGCFHVPGTIDPGKYKRLWSFKVDRTERDEIGFGFPLIRDGLVYIIHEKRFSVRCFDIETGKVLWRRELSESIRGYEDLPHPPSARSVPGGLIIGRACSTRAGFLLVVGFLDRRGDFERIFDRKGTSADVEVDEGVIVLNVSGRLEKLPTSHYEIVDLKSASSKQVEVPGLRAYPCAIHNGRIFGGSRKPEVEGISPRLEYCCVIDAKEGRLLALAENGPDYLLPEFACFAGSTALGSMSGNLVSFSMQTAKLLWKISTAEIRAGETNEPRKAAYHPGFGWVIYGILTSIRRERGQLPITAMRMDTREPVWRTDTEDHVVLLVTDSHVIGRGGPGLSAYDIETGKRTVLEKKIGAYEAALADGYLVMTTADSVVCARIA
jgi:hypothetical protein